MTKRKVLSYLTLNEYGLEYNLWNHVPEWDTLSGLFLSRKDGNREGLIIDDLRMRRVKDALGITLKPGQCQPLEICPLPLVPAKDLKP